MIKNELKKCLKARYRLFIWRYIAYARMRGFQTFNDAPYHVRGFITCWAEPGFHRFWQVWNPGIAFFVYRIYLFFGGNKHWIVATILAFEINGFIHSFLFYLISGGQWSYTIPVLFFLFALLTILSKVLENVLKQYNWPSIFNIAINVFLVIIGFNLSFKINSFIISLG